MCLSTIGTQFGSAAQAVDTCISAILTTADEFCDALKGTAMKAGGTLNADLQEHQKAYEIFTKMTVCCKDLRCS